MKTNGTVSKTSLVLEVMSRLGKDTSAGDILKDLKSRGEKLKIQQVNGAKSYILRSNMAIPAPQLEIGGITISDIETVKKLTDRIGAEKVKELADVLA